MITKIPNTIWEISPADLIRIHEQLLINLGEEMTCHHGEWSSWESELRKHIRRITAALNVMHNLGCPADSQKMFKEHRWADKLTQDGCEVLIEASASLFWVKGYRNYLFD